MATQAATARAEACIGVVDGVDGDARALSVGDGRGDVGAVLIGDVGAAVVRIDAVGDHEDDAGLVRWLRLRTSLILGVGGPVLDEVREGEVRAGAGASQTHGQMQGFSNGGTIGCETSDVSGGDDAAILHVADEDLGPLRQVVKKTREHYSFRCRKRFEGHRR